MKPMYIAVTIVGILGACVAASTLRYFFSDLPIRNIPISIGQAAARVLPPGRAMPSTEDDYGYVTQVVGWGRSSAAKEPANFARQTLTSLKRATGSTMWNLINPTSDTIHPKPQRINEQPDSATCKVLDWSSWADAVDSTKFLCVWASSLVWYAMPVRFLIWHLAVCSLMTWRTRLGLRTRAGEQAQVGGHNWLASVFRLAARTALFSAMLPALADVVFNIWRGFESGYIRIHERSGVVSLGSFGYAGVWLGAAMLHAMMVHRTSKRVANRRDAPSPQQVRKCRWRTALAWCAVAGFLSFPLILAWFNRLLPDDIWLKYIPF